MLRNPKHVFWEALLITIFVFGVGLLLGIFIEQGRASAISEAFMRSEVDMLDVKVQADLISAGKIDCATATEFNIEFGDRIYADALLLEKYEKASRITASLIEQHRRYDLLRALFWVNSMNINKLCGDRFHTIVYFYDYDTPDLIERSRQSVFANFLAEVKQTYGSQVVLIPMAKNLNLSAIDMLASKYGISEMTIMLDEKVKVSDVEKLGDIIAAIEAA